MGRKKSAQEHCSAQKVPKSCFKDSKILIENKGKLDNSQLKKFELELEDVDSFPKRRNISNPVDSTFPN